jgi:hypothetical protein
LNIFLKDYWWNTIKHLQHSQCKDVYYLHEMINLNHREAMFSAAQCN